MVDQHEFVGEHCAIMVRELASLTPLEVDEHLAARRGKGCPTVRGIMTWWRWNGLKNSRFRTSCSTSRCLGTWRSRGWVGGIACRPQAETETILAQASPAFRLIYSALRQCGARPGELCRATIADVDRPNRVITLKEHKTVRKTGKARRIPIGRKLDNLLDQAIGDRTEGPVFLCPSGRGWRVENLSRTYSRLRDLAGLPKDLVLYLARHECGTKI